MRLSHLALAVADQDASARFYERYFDFDLSRSRRYEDGVLMLVNGDDFALALQTEPQARKLPEFVHFGFRLDSPAEVQDTLRVFKDEGLAIVEQWDEPDYVSFKCLDPDGYKIEVFWEPWP